MPKRMDKDMVVNIDAKINVEIGENIEPSDTAIRLQVARALEAMAREVRKGNIRPTLTRSIEGLRMNVN